MDASKKAMENFDSLWFFNNVLSPCLQEEEDTVEEENKPNILHNVPVGAEILVPRCPNCGEIADVGVEQRQAVQPVQAAEFAKPERRKRGGRRRRRRRSKRKVGGELDSGFYGNLDSESSFSEETKGQYYYRKMPPFNDGSAMKEHLKLWAYAVACTVR
ncbi:hypothetical protein HRI_001438300 [Hibiscus trionum]|uniref:Uncharacterized protein n=1 Tax=Hibiscus trionum TaxID=183268 RepID=A0A9W7LWK3_HIBTR|nr:hypothetical protein HRI_001438300 [Hibiscus trionum]